eukprot:Rmarinus@m.12702
MTRTTARTTPNRPVAEDGSRLAQRRCAACDMLLWGLVRVRQAMSGLMPEAGGRSNRFSRCLSSYHFAPYSVLSLRSDIIVWGAPAYLLCHRSFRNSYFLLFGPPQSFAICSSLLLLNMFYYLSINFFSVLC